MICSCCGRSNKRTKFFNEYKEILCDSCVKMYKLHDKKYIPPKGEVHYDEDGNFICHICGRSFKKLAGHIKSKHKLNNDEYKKMFELNRSQSLTGKNFIPNITVDITKVSYDTRFKCGHRKSSVKRRMQAAKNKKLYKVNKE